MKKFKFIDWRKRMGWTQKKAAIELGYERTSTISHMETGKINPTKRVELACLYLEQQHDNTANQQN